MQGESILGKTQVACFSIQSVSSGGTRWVSPLFFQQMTGIGGVVNEKRGFSLLDMEPMLAPVRPW